MFNGFTLTIFQYDSISIVTRLTQATSSTVGVIHTLQAIPSNCITGVVVLGVYISRTLARAASFTCKHKQNI